MMEERCYGGLGLWLWLALATLLIALPAAAATRIMQSPADAACKTAITNAKGTTGADITVDATAGGITVLDADATRCGAIILNSSANDMRCAASGDVTVTTTQGFLIDGGAALVLGLEAQAAWKCIRTGGSSATASIVEAL